MCSSCYNVPGLVFVSINACCVNGLGNGGLFADHCFVSNNIKGNNQNKPQNLNVMFMQEERPIVCSALLGPL